MPITYAIQPHDRFTTVYDSTERPIGTITAPRIHPNRHNPDEANWTIATTDGIVRWSRRYRPPHSIVCAILSQHSG